MNRKRNDDLIRLAFGDLRESEAEQLRAELSKDPQAMRELGAYEGLRADLRCLDDIPEPQISTEMIRDAILKQGLKPAGARPSILNFAWLPVAAAATLFGVVVVQRLNTGEIPVVTRSGSGLVAKGTQSGVTMPIAGAEVIGSGGSIDRPLVLDTTKNVGGGSEGVGDGAVAMNSKTDIGNFAFGTAQTESKFAPEKFAIATTVGSRPAGFASLKQSSTRQGAEKLGSQGSRSKEDGTTLAFGNGSVGARPKSGFASRGGPIRSGAGKAGNVPRPKLEEGMLAAAGRSGADSEPLVMIETDQDGQSGAQRATEVESTSNVLVGG